MQRQLDVPLLPLVGGNHTLKAYTRYSPLSQFHVVRPYVSTNSASIRVPPFGTLLIDPMQAASLPAFLIPQPAGVASVTMSIPNIPALAGIHLYSQAIHLQYLATERLTNGTADRIIR